MRERGQVPNPYADQIPAWLKMLTVIKVIEGRSTNGHRLKVDGNHIESLGDGYLAAVVSAKTGESLGQRFVRQNDEGGFDVEIVK